MLPEAARAMFRLMLDLLAGLNGKIAALDKEIARRASRRIRRGSGSIYTKRGFSRPGDRLRVVKFPSGSRSKWPKRKSFKSALRDLMGAFFS